MRTRGFAILTVLAAMVTPSYAGVIQNWFAGTVFSVSRSGTAPDLFHIGDPVWGLLTYNIPATPVPGTSTSTSANYLYNPSDIYGLSIRTGGYTFATTATGGPFVLDIKNDDYVLPSLTDDVYAVGRRGSDLPGNPGLFYGGQIYETIHILQQNEVGPTLLVTSPGVSLPFSIDLSRATSAKGYIQSKDLTNGYKIDFNITDFGQTPEPGSLPLILGGIAVLTALQKTRARR